MTIYRRISILFLVLYGLYVVVAETNLYLLPKAKDSWRFIIADHPNTIVLGYYDQRGVYNLYLDFGTGKWNGYLTSLDNNGNSFSTMSWKNDDDRLLLSLPQRAAVKKWAESLPSSETNAPSQMLRIRIAVNMETKQHVYEYTQPEMTMVMAQIDGILKGSVR
jgi:hypothetical protein